MGLATLRVRVECTLGLPDGNRLERIIGLIEGCDASIHDLSMVGLTNGLPRFNMPFELGIALHHAHRARHRVFVFERKRFRLQRTTSDVSMLDPLIHGGTQRGVMARLRDILRQQEGGDVAVPAMLRVLRAVGRKLPEILRMAGTQDVFSAAVFRDLAVAASIEATPH